MNWNEYFFGLIPHIAAKSKDPSTKTGCIIVDQNNAIISTGFNGFPRGVDDDEKRYNVRSTKYKFVVHAEANCIYNAAKKGISLENTTLYIDWTPCNECMKAIIQSGIKTVYINGDSELFKKKDLFTRWKDSLKISMQMAEESQINIGIYQQGHMHTFGFGLSPFMRYYDYLKCYYS